MVRNAKQVATHLQTQNSRVFNSNLVGKSFESFVGNPCVQDEDILQTNNVQANLIQKQKNFQGTFAPKTHRVQQHEGLKPDYHDQEINGPLFHIGIKPPKNSFVPTHKSHLILQPTDATQPSLNPVSKMMNNYMTAQA